MLFIGNRTGDLALFHPKMLQMELPTMLYWSLIFLVVALVAAVFGFSGIAAASAGIARVLFGLFLILFVVSFVFQLLHA